jgi:hypothetical protein
MGASLKLNTVWRGPADRCTAEAAIRKSTDADTPPTATESLVLPATANLRVLTSDTPSKVRYNRVVGGEKVSSAQQIHKHETTGAHVHECNLPQSKICPFEVNTTINRPDHDQEQCYHQAPTVKPVAATAVVVAPDDGHEDARNMLSCI